MDLLEYEKVKQYNYLEYCDYLQNKYGIGLSDYMTKTWNKNPKVTRTNEGLLAHHKYEDHAIMLSNKNFAIKNPFASSEPERRMIATAGLDAGSIVDTVCRLLK